MLDTSAQNLADMIVNEAIPFQRRHVDLSWKMVRQYAGKDYRTDWKIDGENFQGHEAAMVFNTVPNLVRNNPKVNAHGLIPVVDDAAGDAVEMGMNQWIPAARFGETLIHCAFWLPFSFAVTMTYLEAVPGYENQPEPLPLWPVVTMLSPFRFFQDPQGGRDHWRYRGHIWVQDKDTLLKAVNPDGTPMFDPKAIAQQGEDLGLKEAGVNKDSSDAGFPRRNRIVGYDIFIRDTGMIHTLGWTSKGGIELRKPRPYGGHADGGYTLYGLYIVPDQVYPLPPLAVTASKVRELNAHRGQVSDDAAAGKNLVLYDKSKPETGGKLARSNNNSVIGIDGLMAGAVQQVKLGGANPANLDYIDRLTFELNETSGLTAQKRGNTTGATAREVDEVAQGDDVRTDFMRTRFQACVLENIDRVAFLMVYSPEVKFLISVESEMGPIPAVYQGGIQPSDDPAFPERLKWEIEPKSMEFVDSLAAQRRAIQNTEIVSNLALLMPQTPWIKWDNVLNDLGESQNTKHMASRYINDPMLQFAQEQALMMQAAAQVQGEQAVSAGDNPPEQTGKGPPQKGGGKSKPSEKHGGGKRAGKREPAGAGR